jgi:hypothetical protein
MVHRAVMCEVVVDVRELVIVILSRIGIQRCADLLIFACERRQHGAVADLADRRQQDGR